MPPLGISFDWLTEFPQGSVALWILFFVTLGGLAVAIFALRKRTTYMEFHNNWKVKYDVNDKTVTAAGGVVMISPAASVTGTCKVRFGKLSAELVLADVGQHMVHANTSVVTFKGEGIDIEGSVTEARIDVRVKLSDGSSKRMKRSLPLDITPRPESNDGDDQATPEPAPEEQ